MENAKAMAKGGVASKLPWLEVDGHKESQPGRKEQRQRDFLDKGRCEPADFYIVLD